MVRSGQDRVASVVEVDETYIGGLEPGKCGQGASGKSLVLIVAQADGRKIGRIRLARIADASAKGLRPAVAHAVKPGAQVQTAHWNGYAGLRDLGYEHRAVRPTADLDENLLPRANRIAALLKRWLLGTHQGAVSPDHLDYYLDEYTLWY